MRVIMKTVVLMLLWLIWMLKWAHRRCRCVVGLSKRCLVVMRAWSHDVIRGNRSECWRVLLSRMIGEASLERRRLGEVRARQRRLLCIEWTFYGLRRRGRKSRHTRDRGRCETTLAKCAQGTAVCTVCRARCRLERDGRLTHEVRGSRSTLGHRCQVALLEWRRSRGR